jgi:hypothetical protein
MLRIEQGDLAKRSGVSVDTIKRLERIEGAVSANVGTVHAIVSALEAAGVIFVEENGEGPGVRLKKVRQGAGTIPLEYLTAENDE